MKTLKNLLKNIKDSTENAKSMVETVDTLIKKYASMLIVIGYVTLAFITLILYKRARNILKDDRSDTD